MDYHHVDTSIRSRDLILADPSTSSWLKAAIVALEARDPLDAEADARLLLEVAGERLQLLLRTR